MPFRLYVEVEMKSMSTAVRGFAAIAIVTMTACQNPVSSGDHLRPQAMEILDGATVLMRAQAVTAQNQPSVTTGELVVRSGEQTSPLAVRFLDTNGEVISPPFGYWLRITPANAAVVRWERASEAEFGGRLVGVSPGEARLKFEWMHGAVGGGHEDRTFDVTAVVLP
jgi:hypothetical protein